MPITPQELRRIIDANRKAGRTSEADALEQAGLRRGILSAREPSPIPVTELSGIANPLAPPQPSFAQQAWQGIGPTNRALLSQATEVPRAALDIGLKGLGQVGTALSLDPYFTGVKEGLRSGPMAGIKAGAEVLAGKREPTPPSTPLERWARIGSRAAVDTALMAPMLRPTSQAAKSAGEAYTSYTSPSKAPKVLAQGSEYAGYPEVFGKPIDERLGNPLISFLQSPENVLGPRKWIRGPEDFLTYVRGETTTPYEVAKAGRGMESNLRSRYKDALLAPAMRQVRGLKKNSPVDETMWQVAGGKRPITDLTPEGRKVVETWWQVADELADKVGPEIEAQLKIRHEDLLKKMKDLHIKENQGQLNRWEKDRLASFRQELVQLEEEIKTPPLSPERRKQNYILQLKRFTTADPSLKPLQARGRKSWFGPAEKRMVEEETGSFVESADAYINMASRFLGRAPVKRKLGEWLVDLPGEKGPLGRYGAEFLDRYMGTPTPFERSVDDIMDRLATKPGLRNLMSQEPHYGSLANIQSDVMRRFYSGQIQFLATSAKNMFQPLYAIPEVGPLNLLKGYTKLMSPQGRLEFQEAKLLGNTAELFELNFGKQTGLMRKIDDMSLSGMRFTEYVNRGAVFHAGKKQAQSFGASAKEAEAYGQYIADMTQFTYGVLGRAPALNTPAAKLVTQYLTFPLKSGELFANWMMNRQKSKALMFLMYSGGMEAAASALGMDTKDLFMVSMTPVGFIRQGKEVMQGRAPAVQLVASLMGAATGQKASVAQATELLKAYFIPQYYQMKRFAQNPNDPMAWVGFGQRKSSGDQPIQFPGNQFQGMQFPQVGQ